MGLLARISAFRMVRALRGRMGAANWEFWIGNAVVVFSTVLGVYLASHTALETAMEFESLRTDRDNYHLRASLRAEVAANLRYLFKHLVEFVARILLAQLVLEVRKHATRYLGYEDSRVDAF